MEKAEKLQNELIEYSVAIITFIKNTKGNIPKSICDQVIRSATSIGANYAEAINASSKADFKNKIYISKKEASETRYWLRIIQKLDDYEQMDELLTETQKFIMILQKTINTLNGGNKEKGKR